LNDEAIGRTKVVKHNKKYLFTVCGLKNDEL